MFGYFTKYDCSSGDINLIGDLSKDSIVQILVYAQKNFKLDSLEPIIKALPSAELTPITDLNPEGQSDEVSYFLINL